MKYEIALSFAGEDRDYVNEVAELLKERNISIFYDLHETASLWGKDLYQHLSEVYSQLARFTIVFVSKHYEQKLWTKHELKNAQARAFRESEEYILPARFDQTELPGLLPTVGYVDLTKLNPTDFVEIIIKKLNIGIEIPFKNKIINKDELFIERRTLLTISDHSQSNSQDIVFNLSEYKSFDEILDDLFLHYLYDKVAPFTYGSQWILTGQPFGMRMLVPINWINKPIAINELSLDWTKMVKLESLGIFPGSRLEISFLNYKFERAYGVFTNNKELAQLLNTEPKAIAFIEDEQFERSALMPSEQYSYELVYRDWLSKVNSNYLIDVGMSLSQRTVDMFNRR